MFCEGWKWRKREGQAGGGESNVFLMFSKTGTHLLTETFSTEAVSDARVAADQNLPGSAVVRQIVFVGVRHRLENITLLLKTHQ